MDTERSQLLHNWNFFPQQKSMDQDEEFRESLALTMDLKLKIREQQISHLNHLLTIAIQERNHAQQNCQKLILEKLVLQSAHSGISEDPTNSFSPSDCDESIVSSPAAELPVAIDGPLPEQGKLLQAVMSAGPLLQTLLVSGTMPQWRHPPPPLDAYQIPTPAVAAAINFSNCGKVLNRRKRGFCEGSESSSVDFFKYQRVLH